MRELIGLMYLLVTAMGIAQIQHQYFVDKTEVDSSFWFSIPDSIKHDCVYEKWEYDTLVTESLTLPLEYYLDSVSEKYFIHKRSEEDIALIKERVSLLESNSANNAYRLHKGDYVPNFTVIRNPDGDVFENVLYPDKCYLINFWATWCGNCLLELLPSEMPRIAEIFKYNDDFIFLPICIDSSLSDLESFFKSERGQQWEHLEYITTLDTDRKANNIFAESGNLPLTIVVGKDMRLLYIHMGRISNNVEFKQIEDAITTGLTKPTNTL